MKRFLAVFLAALLCVCMFAGCKEDKEEEKEPVEGAMPIATSTGDFAEYANSHEERIELLYEAGFRYIDLSFCDTSDNDAFLRDNWQEYAASLKKLAEEKGMTFVQAHAVTGNAFKNESTYQHIVKSTIRAIEVCQILEIPQIVVHAPYDSDLSVEEAKAKTLAFYQEFFPIMEQTGVKVLIENSAESMIGCEWYFYSGESMRQFLEEANNPLLGACWDTGHANIEGHQYEDILALGDLLYGIHFNDNHGEVDEHLVPYMGTMSIDEVMCALIKIGYDGAFTFESNNSLIHSSSWLYSRNVYKDSLKAYIPSLEIKMETEKTMLHIGEYILTQYEIPIA